MFQIFSSASGFATNLIMYILVQITGV